MRNAFTALHFDFFRAGLVFKSSENFKANSRFKKGKKRGIPVLILKERQVQCSG